MYSHGQRSVRSNARGSSINGDVVRLSTESCFDLMLLANNTTTPTVFDLCDRHLHYNGVSNTTLTATNITLRNGTIHLGEGPSESGACLCVEGQGVELDNITICGGKIGLWITPGSDALVNDCVVHSAHTGVWVGYTSTPTGAGSQIASQLFADILLIYSCGEGGALRVGAGGQVRITDLEIGSGQTHGVEERRARRLRENLD